MDFDYNKAKDEDIIGKLEPFIQKGAIKLKEGGQLELQIGNPHKPPWYYVRPDIERDCFFWHDIIFPIFNFVPTRCFDCWKVVVRPRTLKELFDLVKIEEDCEFFCKCGLEIRPSVCGNYGGYFYFNSQDEGLDGLDAVRKLVGEGISKDVPVFLKRACTEYEHKIPNSHKWTKMKGQKEIEQLYRTKITNSMGSSLQNEDQKRHVFKLWIEHAYSIGDMTYLYYTDRKPLYPKYVKYERPEA